MSMLAPSLPLRESLIRFIVIPLSLVLLQFLINCLLIWVTFRLFKITFSRKRFISFLLLVHLFSYFFIFLIAFGIAFRKSNGYAGDSSPTFFEGVSAIGGVLILWCVPIFFYVRWLLKKFFEISVRRNIISLIIAVILFPVFSGFIAGKLISLFYVSNNVSNNYNFESVVCRPVVPGYLTVTLKDTISLAEAEAFTKSNLIDKLGFDKANIFLDTSPPTLGPSDTRYRTAKLFTHDAPNSSRNIYFLVGRLRSDSRVESLSYTPAIPYSFDLGLMGIILRKGTSLDKFLNDYPDAILFPEYIEIIDYNRQSREQLFTYVTLTEEFNFLQKLKEQIASRNPEDSLTIAYKEKSGSFWLVFPAHYSPAEIKKLIGDAGENHTFNIDFPSLVSFGLRVPEGEESQWITKLTADGNVQKVEQQHQICPS